MPARVQVHAVADLEAAYARFLPRAVEAGAVWVLVSPKGKGAVVDSHDSVGEDDLPLICELVFSSEALARRLAIETWRDYQPRQLSLDTYLGVLRMFVGRLVIPDPTADCAGVEVVPTALGAALNAVRAGEVPDLAHLSGDTGD